MNYFRIPLNFIVVVILLKVRDTTVCIILVELGLV